MPQFWFEDIWGIGSASSAKLKALGIKTAKQFRDYENGRQIKRIFTKVGLQTKEELKGHPRFKLELKPAKKKEIMCSRTFGSSQYDIEALKESIANYTFDAMEKLRNQESVCNKIDIFFRTSPFKNTPQHYAYKQIKVSGDTGNSLRVIKYALSAVEEIFRYGFEYKKAGVRIGGIKDENFSQLSLIEENDTSESKELMKVIDKINRIYGPRTIKSLSCGVNNEAWKMNREFKSPSYLTGYGDLPKV